MQMQNQQQQQQQPQNHLSIALGSYRGHHGGSLPNVNQMAQQGEKVKKNCLNLDPDFIYSVRKFMPFSAHGTDFGLS